jgi:hypothetical protein
VRERPGCATHAGAYLCAFNYMRGVNALKSIARGSLIVAAAVATDARVPGGDVGFEEDPSAEDERDVEAEARGLTESLLCAMMSSPPLTVDQIVP